MKGKNMSNLIRYIIQEDPEKQMKKNNLDYTKYSTSWAPIQKQSQEEKYKGYKFSSKNLLENSFNSLTSNKSSQSKDDGSFMSGISNIFNNIKSDEKSSSNTSLPQSIAKTAAEESSKISTVLSPKSIGNDAASYKIAQNNKGNIAEVDIPRYWETSQDGKKVYDYVLQKEGDIASTSQHLGEYAKNFRNGTESLIKNKNLLSPKNYTDKYKHAFINCNAAQFGEGGIDAARLLSLAKETKDVLTLDNTLDSSIADNYANKIGRLLGKKYPNKSCDTLIQKYIKKHYK